jgi:hypothetical protein
MCEYVKIFLQNPIKNDINAINTGKDYHLLSENGKS